MASTKALATEQKAIENLKQYLFNQNRPYSLIDIHNNMHKEFSKAVMQKALDTLVESSFVIEKAVSKQKIYWPNQAHFPAPSDDDLKGLDEEIRRKSADLKELTQQIRCSEQQCKALNDAESTEELKLRAKKLAGKQMELVEQLDRAKNNPRPVVSKEEKNKLMNEKSHLVKEWRKRKRTATDILDGIMENYPKKKKDLMEEMGVEDENTAVLMEIASKEF